MQTADATPVTTKLNQKQAWELCLLSRPYLKKLALDMPVTTVDIQQGFPNPQEV